MTHTPGPWTVVEYGDDDSPTLVIHRDAESRVCFMATPGSHGDPAQIEADARLIAAAPDFMEATRVRIGKKAEASLRAMLEAMEAMEERDAPALKILLEMYDKTGAAIAKTKEPAPCAEPQISPASAGALDY